MAIHDPEDAPWWYIYGHNKAIEFVNRVAPNINLGNVRINPEKKIDLSAPDLIVEEIPSELKTQETPYFKARRDYGIDPQYAVSFNRGDYELYSDRYPDLPIYFWVNWQEFSKFGIEVQPMFGVYRVPFPSLARKIEDGTARIHEYVNRRGDRVNETHSYGFDLREFECLTQFDPRKKK